MNLLRGCSSCSSFSLRRLRLARKISMHGEVIDDHFVTLCKSHKDDKEITIYLKGFLGLNESADQFSVFYESHKRLVPTHGWSCRAYGYSWNSGKLGIAGGVLHPLPLPIATVSHMLWALYSKGRLIRLGNPATAAMFIFGELAIASAQVLHQYYTARNHIDEHAHLFAKKLLNLRNHYSKIRIVATSLGCLLLVKTLQELRIRKFDFEVHLLSPAITEDEASHILPYIDDCVIYYHPDDWILNSLFVLLHLDNPLGISGSSYCRSINVSDFFGLNVHRAFPTNFPDFAVDFVEENKRKDNISGSLV